MEPEKPRPVLNSEDGKAWTSDWDAKKELLDVHLPRFKRFLGKDFKMVHWTEKKKEFIQDMVSSAVHIESIAPKNTLYTKRGRKQFKNLYIEEVQMMLMYPVNTLAVVDFNAPGNMIVDRVTGWQQPESGDSGESKWDKLKDLMQREVEA